MGREREAALQPALAYIMQNDTGRTTLLAERRFGHDLLALAVALTQICIHTRHHLHLTFHLLLAATTHFPLPLPLPLSPLQVISGGNLDVDYYV